MNYQPLVSIIMNCYNGEKYLRKAIDSILAQTYTNWEIIFWDNQSTDGSAAIFKNYIDPRFKYHYAPAHTLLYEARNYAVQKASGKLLAFLDVDDWWSQAKLERQVPLFDDPSVGIACTNFWIVHERKQKSWVKYSKPIPAGWVTDALLQEFFIGLLTLVVRRSAFESLEYPFDPRYHVIGDVDLEVRLSTKWKLGTVQEPLAYYRMHDTNESVKHRERHIAEVECWLGEMRTNTAISASPSWARARYNHIYVKAINQLLLGKRRSAHAEIVALPWGRLRLRLALLAMLPTLLVRRLKS